MDVYKIIELYQHFPTIAVWKALIINQGVNSCLDKKKFEKRFRNYKIKYAIKSPVSSNYEVLDSSSDQRVIPSEIIIRDDNKNSSLVKLRYNPKSPIRLSIEGKSRVLRLYLERGKSKILAPLDILLLREKGNSVISLLGTDRLSVVLFDGCWNWNTGCQCKFCDLNPKRKDYNSVVPSLNDLRLCNFDYKRWWNKYKKDFFKALKKDFRRMYLLAKPHKHLLIMSGGFIDNVFLWEMIIELVTELNRLVPLNKFDNYINVPPPTKNIEKNFLKLKKLGVTQMQINLEVTNESKFAEICPGKHKTIGYRNYNQALEKAVKIFGRGKVRSNFVFTSRSSQDLLREANRLARLGVVMDYSIFQPKKGTPWAKKKGPSINEIINFSDSLAKIYSCYGFQGIYCNLSSRSSIINEILQYGN